MGRRVHRNSQGRGGCRKKTVISTAFHQKEITAEVEDIWLDKHAAIVWHIYAIYGREKIAKRAEIRDDSPSKGVKDERREAETDRAENRLDQGGSLEDRPADVPVQGPQGEKRPLLTDQLHPQHEEQNRLCKTRLRGGAPKGNRSLQAVQEIDGRVGRLRHRGVKVAHESVAWRLTKRRAQGGRELGTLKVLQKTEN